MHTCPMTERVAIVELHRVNEAFDVSVPGYERDWWSDLGWAMSAQPKFLVAFVEDEEVARSVILEHKIQVPIADFDARHPTLEISRFEVRGDRRRRGIGRAAVATIREMWPQHQLVVFSDQDGFWRRAGLMEHGRIGGVGHEPSIFVAKPLSQSPRRG